MARFLRVVDEDKETAFNLDLIWKVEVTYVFPDPTRPYFYWKGFRELAADDPQAIRYYRVFIGSDSLGVPANPDDPISRCIEELLSGSSG